MLANNSDTEHHESSYRDFHISSLAEIYQQHINMCIWQRNVPAELITYAQDLLQKNGWNIRLLVDIKSIEKEIYQALPDLYDQQGRIALTQDISLIATLFADLFELKTVGIRFSVLDSKMCPRFHTDNLPCRLVTTYIGPGTEWLPDHAVNRSKLGHVSSGVPDLQSGVYSNQTSIEQLSSGDVALMKGSGWEGCENPVVHRSPDISSEQRRLILTIDFAN